MAEQAAGSVHTQTAATAEPQLIVIEGMKKETAENDLNQSELFTNRDSNEIEVNAERSIEDKSDEPLKDANEEYDEENVKYILYCQCCGEALDTLEELKDHLLEFHDIADVADPEDNHVEDVSSFSKCGQCTAVFLDENDLQDHMKSEHTDQENVKPADIKEVKPVGHKCQFCDQTFYVRSDLDLHVELEHDSFYSFDDDNLYGSCPYCPRLYLAKWASKSLKRHIRVDHPGKDVNVPVEMIEVKDKNNLRKLKNVKKEPGMEFPCKYCHKVFIWQKSLSRHIKLFHANKLRNLSVQQRKEILGRERSKQTDNEDSVPVYPCPCCSKEFLWQKSLKRHVLELHGDTIDQFDDKLVKVKERMSKQFDSGKDYFKCLYCSLISKYAHSIRNHMIRKHPELDGIDVKEIILPTVDAVEGIRKAKANDRRSREERLSECSVVFKCPKCSYATNNQSNLQRHLTSRVHKEDFANKDLIEKKMSEYKVKQTASKFNTTSLSAVKTSTNESSRKGSEEEVIDTVDDQSDNDDDTIETEEHREADDETHKLYTVEDIPELCKTSYNFKVTFQCPECSEHAFSFEKLEEHYKTEHEGIPFHVTKNEVLVVEQVKKSVRPGKAIDCPYCDLILSQLYLLQKHVSLIHHSCLDSINIKQEPSDTDIAPEDLYKDDGTMVEPCKSSVVTAYRCQTCICVFPNILDLVRHMEIIHPGVDKSMSMPKTPKKRGRKRKVKEAEIMLDPQEAKKASLDSSVAQYDNKCPHCHFSCKRASALTFHINFNHANIKTEPETEETPQKKIRKEPVKNKSRSSVKRKQQSSTSENMVEELPVPELEADDDFVHLDQPARRFKCAYCTTGAFISVRMLERHVKRLHPEQSQTFSSADIQPVESEFTANTATVEDDFGLLDDVMDADYQPDENECLSSPLTYNKRFKCPYCTSGAFISGRVLERHVKRLHPEQSKTFSLEDAKCVESKSTTTTPHSEHSRNYTCSYCKKSFDTGLDVHNHMKTEHKFAVNSSNKKKGFYPGLSSSHAAKGDDECVDFPSDQIVPATITAIKAEKYDNTMDDEGEPQLPARMPVGLVKCESGSLSFKCRYCNMFFLSKASVIRHASSLHPREKKLEADDIEPILNQTDKVLENCFQCPYCTKTSTWKKCIVRHVKKQHPEVANFDPEDIPIETGVSRGDVKLPEVSQYECPYCQSIHKWKKSIVRHIRTNHPYEKQDIDLKSICLDPRVNSSVRKDIKRGTHLKRLVHCPKCDFKCRARLKMKRHFKLSHPNASNYVTDSLFKYRYVHNEERRDSDSRPAEIFTCHVCQMTYTWKKSLMHHMKVNHPNQAEVCETVWSMVHIVDRALGNYQSIQL